MSSEFLVTAFQAASSSIFGLIGIWFVWRTARQDREKKSLEIEEGSARMDLALNISVQTKVHRERGHCFIETFVDIHNPSHTIWTVPAVYVSYRALFDSTDPSSFTGKEGFDDLPACDGLRVTRNRAHLERSIWTVSPDERVRLVRIDRVSADRFLERYPVLWVSVEAFGASYALLGKDKSALNGFGQYRRDWLAYSTLLEREDEAFIAFGRLDPFSESNWEDFSPGDRCLVKRAGAGMEPDKGRSFQFRAMLASVSQWTMDATIVLSELKAS